MWWLFGSEMPAAKDDRVLWGDWQPARSFSNCLASCPTAIAFLCLTTIWKKHRFAAKVVSEPAPPVRMTPLWYLAAYAPPSPAPTTKKYISQPTDATAAT